MVSGRGWHLPFTPNLSLLSAPLWCCRLLFQEMLIFSSRWIVDYLGDPNPSVRELNIQRQLQEGTGVRVEVNWWQIYCSKWGWCQLKLGFSLWCYCGPTAEEIEMHGRPALLALCSNNGCLKRIVKTKRAHNLCVASTAEWQERSSRNLLGSSKKGIKLTFLVESTRVFVCFHADVEMFWSI